jgi:hypothetical protein
LVIDIDFASALAQAVEGLIANLAGRRDAEGTFHFRVGMVGMVAKKRSRT